MNIFRILLAILPLTLNSVHWKPISPDAEGHEWMDQEIDRQFTEYGKLKITQKKLEATWKNLELKNDYQRYKVIRSRVFGPSGVIRNLLETMVKHYKVPDVDFIWFNWDCLMDRHYKADNELFHVPIFVGAKHVDQKKCLLLMDWYYDINAVAGPNCWNAIIDQFNAAENLYPWSNKIDKLFWRGSPTDGYYRRINYLKFPRGKLVHLSSLNTSIDAAFVIPGHRSWMTKSLMKYLRVTSPVSLLNHLPFKYQMIIDGVTCTFPGTQWRLYSGCVPFMQETSNILWFSRQLQPFVHYVPVKNDMSDLSEKIVWAQTHDEECKMMAEEAKIFAKTHLMPEHILLYCYKMLVKYASMQSFTPEE